MKNIANCKPSEFLKQTVKIRKYVADWLTVTKILEIRKNAPEFKQGATDEEKQNALYEQAQTNLYAMFDSVMDDNADKTLGLLALLNFVEPENVDDYTVADYLGSIGEMLSCPEVLSFFSSLVQLAKPIFSKQLKQ